MARYITIGEEFVNLDKVCSIQVYTRTNAHNDIVIAKIEFDHSIKKFRAQVAKRRYEPRLKMQFIAPPKDFVWDLWGQYDTT